MSFSRIVRDGLLAVGVMFCPAILVAAGVCAMAAWQSGLEPAATVELMAAAFVFASWALWSYLSGPVRLRGWWFGIAALVNAVAGVGIVISRNPHSLPIGAAFLACSFWQFFVFRQRWTYCDDAE